MKVLGLTTGFLVSSFTIQYLAHASVRKKAAPEVYTASDPQAAPADFEQDGRVMTPADRPLLAEREELESSSTPTVVTPPTPASAIEAYPPGPTAQPGLPAAASEVSHPAPPVSELSVPRPPSTTASVLPRPEAVMEWGKFESVPEDQKQAFGKRLALMNEIIQKYGRAYDYRTHTIAELQKLLQILETSKK
jgi:hypothetical protein